MPRGKKKVVVAADGAPGTLQQLLGASPDTTPLDAITGDIRLVLEAKKSQLASDLEHVQSVLDSLQARQPARPSQRVTR